MKKFNFKWLLLSIILSIASINTAWATVNLKGSWDGWSGGPEFVDGVATLEITKVDSYQFKIQNTDGNKWTGAGSYDGEKVISSASTSVTLSSEGEGSNVGFNASVAGVYTFTLSGSNLSVTYPTTRTYNSGQKIYLKDVASAVNWNGDGAAYWGQYGNVYAYFSGDGASWSAAATVASGSKGTANAIYEITVPGSGKKFTTVYFARGSSTSAIWDSTPNQTTAIGYNCFYISSTAASTAVYKGSWGKYAKTYALLGSFNDWNPDANVFDANKRTKLTLPASTDYRFTILEGETYYACSMCSKITNTTAWFEVYSGQSDLSMTTGEAGEYCFHYDNHWFALYYPQARLVKQKYIYLDTRPFGTGFWNTDNASYRFYFKHYNTGLDIAVDGYATSTYNSDMIDDNGRVFPVRVSNYDDIGKIQLNRYSSDGSEHWGTNASAVIAASGRSSTSENCMLPANSVKDGSWDDWTTGWTTYCPIKKTSSISDNGTVKTWGGSGTSGSPYYVATGSKIKVSSASTDHISDGNMTTKYDFQVRNASDVQQAHSDGTATTYEYTVPATNDVVYKVRVNSYNYYNSTSSTDKWSTDIYYKARTPYTISYNAGTGGSGSKASETKLKGVDFTLPNSAVFTRDHYTQTGWTTSDLGAQTHSLGGTYSSDVAQEFFPAWTEDEYTVTTSSGTGGSVDEDSYSAFVATTTAISATPAAGYKFHSWEVVSGDVTFADQYSASTTMNATSDAEIKANFVYRWSIAGSWLNYPETENWDADTYYMGNIGTNASSKDTCYVEISLAANTSYTFDVVDRSTSPYTFHKNGNDKIYYMTYGNSTNWGFGTTTGYNYDCGITTAGAGTYKFAYNITDGKVTVTYPNSYTVTFGYGTGGSAVTASVEDAGSINSGDYATAGKDITFTKTAANLAYTFKGWYNASSDGDAISCMASDDVYDDIAANISVYAQFKTRYGLHGSLMDDVAGGMPGWAGDGDDFVVRDYTDIGEGDGKGVELKCWRVLEPNREYKFRVQDRAAGSRWGLSESAVLPAEGVGSNVKLSTYGDENGKDVFLYTVGEGEYVFHITNMYDNSDGKYYPAIQVDRPASSQLTMGVYDSDHGSLSASSYKNNTFAITDGQFYANGSTLTFHATPNTGYHVEGWYSDASCETPYVSGTDGATICDPGDVSLVLSSVSTNKTVYVKFAEDTNTFSATSDNNWSTVANWSAGAVPAITDVVYITAPVTVDIANAKAKRVYIDQSSAKTGKLTVGAGKALVVAATIQKINSSSEIVATEETDIVLQSDGTYGTGALIAGSESTDTKATVQFYTLARKNASDKYVNQYFGPAFVSAPKINYYGAYLRTYSQSLDQWISFSPEESSLTMFNAYRIMREEQDDGETYNVSGTLYLPGTGEHKKKELILYNNAEHDNDNMFSNSYTAPIDITNMTASDFVGATATIYIFNAGSKADADSHGETAEKGRTAGQWLAIPIQAPAVDPAAYDVILPSQQAFLVQADGLTGTHTLTLDYDKHVYTPALSSVTITPTHAPKRRTVENTKDVEIMHIYVNADESNLGDRLYIYMNDDFKAGEMDNGWEGYKMSAAANVPQLCAFSDLGEMSIMALPSAEGTVLGFYAGTEDDHYTFTFDYEGTGTWYLNDLDENESTLIDAANEYQFTATKGTVAASRFTISKSPISKTPTGVDEVDGGVKVRKQMINGTLYIIRDGRIYNAEGSLVK